MKLMSLKQYMSMSKPALIRKIMKTLKAMPKAKLARLCYNITKAKLHHLTLEGYIETQTRKEIKEEKRKALPKRKTKRKFSRKQLAAQRLFAKRARAGTLRK